MAVSRLTSVTLSNAQKNTNPRVGIRLLVGTRGLEPGTKRFFWSNRLTLRCSKEFLWVAKRDLAIPLDHFHIRHNVMKS